MAILVSLIKKTVMKTRGERNNNPFNMNRTGTSWVGEVRPGSDPRFAEFKTLDYGLRAGLINLMNGYFSKGLTLAEIIRKYAPAFENNTMAYIKSAERRSGVLASAVPQKLQYVKVAEAILFHENGKVVADENKLRAIIKDFNLTKYM